MQIKIGNCSNCNQTLPIVNKKYCLCNSCNRLRLGTITRQTSLKRSPLKNKNTIKSKKRISAISKKNKTIADKLKETYESIYYNREKVCSGCGKVGLKLDNSHIIKRSRARSIGKVDLIYLKENIVYDCESCHEIWDYGTLQQKKQLLNFSFRLQIIEKYDLNHYTRLINDIDEN